MCGQGPFHRRLTGILIAFVQDLFFYGYWICCQSSFCLWALKVKLFELNNRQRELYNSRHE